MTLRDEAASAGVAANLPPSGVAVDVAPQPFAGVYIDSADRRPDPYTPAPPKRKASDLSRNLGDGKRQKSGGFGHGGGEGGDQRLISAGRMRAVYGHCERILDTLMRDPASMAYFNMPVDPIGMGGRLTRVFFSEAHSGHEYRSI